ncbi:hypothetical protein H7I57_04170 [Mycobacterium pyrenivorans]|nr:hypothetical protein [Mycolicibacterium pyrenivorans]
MPVWVAIILSSACVVPACTRSSDGVPTAAEREVTTTETSEAAPPSPGQWDDSEPGVVPTTQPPAPAGTVSVPPVLPPVRTVAQVSDPGAPTATVGVPDGWSMSSGNGDPEGARLEGPEGMEAVVTITPTPLDPAFREYVDALTEDATVSTVSTLPGELCGYSGQKLMGMLSDNAQSVEYEDRIVHVDTAAQDYLIVVHVEAPSGTPGFDDAASVLTGDFEIGLR